MASPTLVSRLVTVAVVIGLAGCSAAPGVTVTGQPAPAVVSVSGSGNGLPIIEALAAAYGTAHPDVQIRVSVGADSGGAVAGVAAGTLDVAVLSRALTAREAGGSLEYYAFAADAVAFAVHLSQPPTNLTSAQIRAIYRGALTDWRQVGGPSEPILVLDRDEGESTRRLGLVPLMAGQPVKARTIVLYTEGDMLKALEDTPGSIGYVSLGALKLRRLAGVTVPTLDGMAPGPKSLKSGAYPWRLTLGLAIRHDAFPAARDFVSYVLGSKGRAVLEENGYVVRKD